MRKGLDRKWAGERAVLRMLVRARTVVTIFIHVRGQHEDGREEAQSETHLGKIGETLVWTSLPPFLDQVYLGCTQRESKSNEMPVDEN